MVSTHFNHHSPVWTDSGNALVRGSYPLKKEAKGRDQTRRLESVDEMDGIKQETHGINGCEPASTIRGTLLSLGTSLQMKYALAIVELTCSR
jgi:hypothetical protein